MSVVHSDGNIYLERLHKIIEEIPSGVRDHDFETILKVQHSQELLKTTNNNIIFPANQWLDNVWKNCNVSKKLEELSDVTKNVDSAWRPVTGEADIRPLLANVLRERKKRLEQEIKKIREQSLALRENLMNCNSILNNNVDKMKNFYLSGFENIENSIQN
ncbi:uncharacterized protein LOC130896612 [Diorhabda carinulata]|uniref:uncharacterized protein LOC130896612 n=1 Tax=Diorhabda carinulata TaxID=1163345 RepID=UPI0025A133BD|nr:uncharacterized protein LOC130896612 [Diorhabda carinulata]